MFGSSSGGGGGVGGGGGGNVKRGKGGGGTSRNNHHNHQPEIIHQVQPNTVLPTVIATNQPLAHQFQPIFQTFHQPGMHPQLYATPIFHYLPGLPNIAAPPQGQYVYPRPQYANSVPVNIQTLGAFTAIPQNLANPSHTAPSQMAALRNSQGPIPIQVGTSVVPQNLGALHSVPSSTSTTTQKKRTHALAIIDPETRKNVLDQLSTSVAVASSSSDDKKVVAEQKKKPDMLDDSANKVDCQMQTDVPVKVVNISTEPVKSEDKDSTSTSQENGEFNLYFIILKTYILGF